LSQRMQGLLVRLLLIAFGFAFGFIILEVGLRLFPAPNRYAYLRQSLALWQSDDNLLMHLLPNLDVTFTGHPEFRFALHTNADGLRDDALTTPQDVVVIGDSFTFGLGVEDSEAYPARLEAISGLRVANLGWAGWNSYVYPAALRRHALTLGARVWVWAFFVNDLPESASAERFITGDGQGYKEQSEAHNLPTFFMQSRAVEFFASVLRRDLLLPQDAGQPFDDGNLQMYVSPYPFYQSDPANTDVQRGWQLTEIAAREIADLANAAGAQVLVVFVPAREHVYWDAIHTALPDFDVTQLDGVATRMGEIASANGFGYLNLLDGFHAEADDGDMLYFRTDGHWNAAGHDLAARLIACEVRGAKCDES
jgi:hypothetical protein